MKIRKAWNKGIKWSEEIKKKISESQRGEKGNQWGKHHSSEVRMKISQSNKGRISPMLGKRHSKETLIKMRLSQIGKRLSEETKQKIREKRKLQIFTLETRKKMSDSHKGDKNSMNNPIHRAKISGKNCHFWKGGITPINIVIRNSYQYKVWHKKVFERDNYTCVGCGQNGGKLNADHIKAFADYKELRFEVSNGRTLCLKCHKKTDSYLVYKGKIKEL